ncbi:hypothetical protein AB0M89_12995 [Streptomyces microflavus]|uniref:hypothetical protein n=1 Tax=Streptomyces microflavus TaxID=1919 RepID=UPI00342550DF
MFNRRKPPETTPPPRPEPQTDPNRFVLRYPDDPDDVGKWLAQHGYRCLISGALRGEPGVLYARPGLPAQIAIIGDTLVYDGHIVTVEPQTAPT